MASEKVPRQFGTHDGTFHADEVTACALLLLFNKIDSDKILRTRDHKVLDTCEFVCDVGGIYDPERLLFDHHQVDYQGSFSSAGMILKWLADSGTITQQDYHFLNNALIKGVDDHDNGLDPQTPGICTYSHVVANFTPIDHEAGSDAQNKAFVQALHFALGHLRRLWDRHVYTRSCNEIVKEAMQNGKECLMFDKSIPWMESFFDLDGENHPALFVIMPSGHHWKLRGIPPNFRDRMKVRLPLPEAWAGLIEDDLKKVCQIPGAVFCHKGRFISVWETKEDALKALDYVLKHSRVLK